LTIFLLPPGCCGRSATFLVHCSLFRGKAARKQFRRRNSKTAGELVLECVELPSFQAIFRVCIPNFWLDLCKKRQGMGQDVECAMVCASGPQSVGWLADHEASILFQAGSAFRNHREPLVSWHCISLNITLATWQCSVGIAFVLSICLEMADNFLLTFQSLNCAVEIQRRWIFGCLLAKPV
jgi:hypothetical protein